MIFMVHPQHGATNVTPAEVADMEKRGWSVSTHAQWMAANGKGPAAEKRKPGRPAKAKE